MFPVLQISGGPRERGRQYGTQAAAQIRLSIANYAALFAYRRGMDWTAVQTAAGEYLPLLADYTPGLLDEMQGIAEGSGRNLREIVALNVRTELLAGAVSGVVHASAAAATEHNRALGLVDYGECTAIAALPVATAGGRTLLAQTWDWTGDQRAACVVLRISSAVDPDIVTLTEAGILAKIGMNSAGLAVTLNILRSRSDGQTPGMPVHVLLRRALECESLDAVVGAARQRQAGASSCVTVADVRGRAVSLELTPGGVGMLEPRDGLLVHTNHCVVAALQGDEYPLDAAATTIPRFDRATELLTRQRGALDVAAFQAILCDHEGAPNCICRHPNEELAPTDRVESVAGVVMDLDARVMHIAADLPCAAPFTPVAL